MYVHMYIYVACPRQDSMSPARAHAAESVMLSCLGHATDLLEVGLWPS